MFDTIFGTCGTGQVCKYHFPICTRGGIKAQVLRSLSDWLDLDRKCSRASIGLGTCCIPLDTPRSGLSAHVFGFSAARPLWACWWSDSATFSSNGMTTCEHCFPLFYRLIHSLQPIHIPMERALGVESDSLMFISVSRTHCASLACFRVAHYLRATGQPMASIAPTSDTPPN